jgi:asparagine synthase (glutamine-hydrolysing)
MVRAIEHEQFYRSGTWVDEASGVYVGWVLRPGERAELMPISDERGQITLVLSGEEFSGLDSPNRGLHNATFPVGLNGWFQGILTDRERGVSTLFNDRYGMHRLYYHESKESFYFAAEAKAILAVCPDRRAVDSRGLGELITCGCVLENRTVFDGIHVLPPASRWVFRNAAIESKGCYFRPQEWEQQSELDPEAYYVELRKAFADGVSRSFAARTRIGMSLTGGLDTRMIMAWQRSPDGSLPCYTFGGMFRDSQDVRVARQVARACHQPFQTIPVDQTFLSRFPEYAERTVYLTDGCANVEHSADLYLNQQAREIAPVRVTGNYGGEVLRRVRAFKPGAPLSGLFNHELGRFFRQARETYATLLEGHPLSFAVFRQAPWHHHGLLALEQTQLSLRSPFLDNDVVRTVFRAPESACVNDEPSLRLISDGHGDLLRLRTDRGLAGGSKEPARTLTRSVLDFTYKAEYAYDYGMPQWVARIDHLLAPLRLERLFLGRHKFTHYRLWYRGILSKYVQEVLLDGRTLSRPYLNRKTVELAVNGHLRGGRNYTTAIHQLLSLELLHRQLVDG